MNNNELIKKNLALKDKIELLHLYTFQMSSIIKKYI